MSEHPLANKPNVEKSQPKNIDKTFPLYPFDMVPTYLQSNPYIRTGYRYGLTAKGCLISLLYLNNESVNIWSHLIGASLFIYFFFRDIYKGKALPLLASTSDYYFVLFYTISVITCMLCSAVFHGFNCVSSRAFANFLKLDLCGIGFSILGCYLYGLHLSFKCFRNWRIRYETMIIGLMFIAVTYYVHGVKRVFPVLHLYYLHGGWSHQFVQHFFPKLFVFYGILGIGLIAFLTRFPERYFPGYFDILLASHQIWHFASLAAFIWWYQGSVGLLQYHLINPCDAQLG